MTEEKDPGAAPDAEENCVKGETPPLGEKNLELTPHEKNSARGAREYAKRHHQVREIMVRLEKDVAWDRMQARDVPPELIDFVAPRLARGVPPATIARDLGLREKGGVNSREWRKIQAFFRQGFRASAEAYLYQQTNDYYKILNRTKEVLEDAFENGTPVIEHFIEEDRQTGLKTTKVNVVTVKGATKELQGMIETYSRAVMLMPKLWKEYAAIGEAPGKASAPGGGGLTIVVKTNVPTPTQAEVDAYRNKMLEMKKEKPVIDVTPEAKVGNQSKA